MDDDELPFRLGITARYRERIKHCSQCRVVSGQTTGGQKNDILISRLLPVIGCCRAGDGEFHRAACKLLA